MPAPTPIDQPSRYPSPLLGRPGAVAATGPDAGVAWHYGDPMGEQRAAERSAAVIDLSYRTVLAVTGPDRLTWLHTLTSQALSDLPNGSCTQALVLSPAGHVEHHMGVIELDGTTYLDTEPATGAALLQYLTMMIFWSKVEVADVSADLGLLRVIGPRRGEIAVTTGLLDRDLTIGSAVALTGGGLAAAAGAGIDLLLPRPGLGAVAQALTAAGARPAGSWAAAALRIAARIPRLGVDTDDRTIPNELGWLDTAVHLNKGCYRGQETVARVHNLGRPPRRLALLHLDGSADRLPEPGEELLTGQGRVVGRVGSAAHHHEDGPIALALVKRSVPADTPLLAGGVDAALDPDEADGPAPAVPQSVIDRRTFTDIHRR